MAGKIVVLVVEDEPLVRLDTVEHLIDERFTVFEACNADEATAILVAELTIQILFTDIDMPGSMDGLRLSAAVRDRWPPVMIIVTSGHNTVDVTDLPSGSIFFPKPYHPQNVSTSVRELYLRVG